MFAIKRQAPSRLEAENAGLRHQLIVLQRKVRGRVPFTNSDRLFFVQLYRWFPSVLKAVTIIRPETLVRWHRAGFRRYWRRTSRSLGGRPQIDADLRALIRHQAFPEPWSSSSCLALTNSIRMQVGTCSSFTRSYCSIVFMSKAAYRGSLSARLTCHSRKFNSAGFAW
jgi:hypothetical protein